MRPLRAARRALVILGIFLIVSALAAIVVLRTPWGARRVKSLAVVQAGKILNGQLEIGQLSGSLLNGVELAGVRLRRGTSVPFTAARIVVRYSALQLIRGDEILIDELEISGLHVIAQRLPSGGLNLSQLLKPRSPSSDPNRRRSVQIRNVRLTGATLSFVDNWGPGWMHLPRDIRDLHAQLDVAQREGQWTFGIRSLSADAREPSLQIRQFAGHLRVGAGAWSVDGGNLRTSASQLAFSVAVGPAGNRTYEAAAKGAPFDFPEMSRIVPGLASLKVPAQLALTMRGPERRVQTMVTVRSREGDLHSNLFLDMVQPGWRGNGTAQLTAFNIAKWLPTTTETLITGSATFDLLLGLGRHFPRGPFKFEGPEVLYAGYKAADVQVTGRLVEGRALVDRALLTAYGSRISTSGWLGLPAPYRFALAGRAAHLDLRRLPPQVPLPKVASDLSFTFDSRGRFQNPVLTSDASFDASTFLGATIAAGTVGRIDTSADPITYTARGRIVHLDLGTVGRAFKLSALSQPAYGGAVSGAFDLVGQGLAASDLLIRVKGDEVEASMFGGRFLRTAVDLEAQGETLSGSGRGRFEGIDSSVVSGDTRMRGRLTGGYDLKGTLPGVFGTAAALADVDVSGRIMLDGSDIGGVEFSSLDMTGRFADGQAQLQTFSLITDTGTVKARGNLGVLRGESSLAYEIDTLDIARLGPHVPSGVRGTISTRGELTGSLDLIQLRGSFVANRFGAYALTALSSSGDYDLQIPSRQLSSARGHGTVEATLVSLGATTLGRLNARVKYADSEAQGDVDVYLPDSRVARVQGAMTLHPDHNEVHLRAARIALGGQEWRLAKDVDDPRLLWKGDSIEVRNLAVETTASGRVTVEGTLGRTKPAGSISVALRDINMEDLPPLYPAAAGYRGTGSGTVLIAGTVTAPEVHLGLSVANGGFRQFTFSDFTVLALWTGGEIQADVRVEQQQGWWLAAHGTVPTDILSPHSRKPVDFTVKSSTINLGIVQGLTTVVADVTGTMQVDVSVRGISTDPHFDGFLNISNAAFGVPATGVRYQNGTARLRMAPDSVVVDQFRVEDDKGDALQLVGEAGTHELRIGRIGLELTASRFELLSNELGDVDVDAIATIAGTLSELVVKADVVLYRATLRVDRLLALLQRPYRVEPSASIASPSVATQAPAPGSLTRRFDLALHVSSPDILTLRGDNLRFTRQSAVALGDIDVTLGGDLQLRRRFDEPLTLTGELAAIRGAYGFQGRRFTLERGGTVRFDGGSLYDPVISLAATRAVSGVEVRVAVQGTATAPEITLSSRPGLEESDILSLLVFNMPANELGTEQREELALQAASLAAGYVASPAISAFGRRLGLDFLQVEQTGASAPGLRVSAGREI